MIKDRKGFTLIELLAVIVILGLLMAIALPSVTKYITESRKKTVVTTISNYIEAIMIDVNSREYKFSKENIVYAVPIECISLERGGSDPFGKWLQANDDYWAYVLVQYNVTTSSYTYGFTFKDSAGYGLYPTTIERLHSSGKQVVTGLKLNRPINGKITGLTDAENWYGFRVNNDTELYVLEASSDGEKGNGESICTLRQKGDNYDDVEKKKGTSLVTLIRDDYPLIDKEPTLTTSSNNTFDASGLYASEDINGGTTYYFRGNVTRNYVKFADKIWRIVRINEDGSIRMILEEKDTTLRGSIIFNNTNPAGIDSMYFSASGNLIREKVNTWYGDNIEAKGLGGYVVQSEFCQQMKVIYGAGAIEPKSVKSYDSYIPSFECKTDNGLDILGKPVLYKSEIGLITYDEVVFAGGYYDSTNSEYYLANSSNRSTYYWTMSPAGYYDSNYKVWRIYEYGKVTYGQANDDGATNQIRPVISLRANVKAKGTGTSGDPYVIQ